MNPIPMASDLNPWLTVLRPSPDAAARLFCFPCAGAGPLMYQAWARGLPPGVELCAVQLPGRGARLREPPVADLSSLVQALELAIMPWLEGPFAFFGHSFGALVGFELARALRRRGRAPARLFVSGHIAPHTPDPNPRLHGLPEGKLIKELRAMNGTPRQLLDCPEIMALLLPALRADLTMLETYAYTPEAPLECPISVFAGQEDPRVTPEALTAWRQQTRADFSLTLLPGDHFYLESCRPQLLSAIAGECATMTRA